MEAETQRRLGASFEHGARAYAVYRPTYPAKAVRWLAGVEPVDVLDLGAGTGSLTAPMAALGHRVTAAELSLAMANELTARVPVVPAVQSTAELLPFAPASFDVVTVATAFHWFDAVRALPEIAAVLRPGGNLALVWNSRVKDDGWTGRLSQLLRSVQPPALHGNWGPGSVDAVRVSGLFGPLEHAEFAFTQTLDRDGLFGLVASRSYVIDLDEDRRRALFESVGRLFDEAAAAGESGPSVELPYVAECWRADRAPAI